MCMLLVRQLLAVNRSAAVQVTPLLILWDDLREMRQTPEE